MLYNTLLTKIWLLKRALRKGSPLVRVTVYYNFDGDDNIDEFLISDDEYSEEAADTFLERSFTKEGRPKSDRVKGIINEVFRNQLWFRITPPEKPPQITEELAEKKPAEGTVAEEEVEWVPVKTEKGYHYADEGVVEIGGKKYRVEKAAELTLSLADIKDLIEEGWFELRVTAVKEPPSGGTYEDADYWWKLKGEEGE